MKAAAVFALRVVVLTVVLIIVFIIAANVVGMAPAPSPSAQPASTPADQAQQAASLFGPLLVYTFLVSMVTACIIQHSRWRGLKLIAALTFTFYGLMTVITQIETIVYLRAKMPLDKLTEHVRTDPAGACRTNSSDVCKWVPKGIAVQTQEGK